MPRVKRTKRMSHKRKSATRKPVKRRTKRKSATRKPVKRRTKRMSATKRRRTATKNPWLIYVKKYRKAGENYSKALKRLAKTYKKK